MKSKSFGAGALGVLLFFAGQSFPVPAETLPAPDRESSIIDQETSALPAPDRDASTLSVPDRETLIIPGPEQGTSSEPSRSSRRAAEPGRRQEEAPAGTTSRSPREAPAAAPAASNRASAVSETPPPRSPPDRGLFFGALVGMNSLSYDTDDTDWEGLDIEGNPTFGGGLFFGMDFGMVVAQAEALFRADKGTIENVPGFDEGTGLSFLLPLIVKGDFHLGPVVLQPLAGLYFNFALGDLELSGTYGGKEPYANPLMGLMVGGDVGIRFGRNLIFLDLRYATDLGKTAVGNDPMTAWRRSAFVLNLGYQFFVWRKT
ncbi:porin family protein [Treponema sp. TIM-1]|uniref:hypothetical protein n=1 Tax=Treponema sp. TIM-1 TaxID=2898417 RepID=UPI0039815AE5